MPPTKRAVSGGQWRQLPRSSAGAKAVIAAKGQSMGGWLGCVTLPTTAVTTAVSMNMCCPQCSVRRRLMADTRSTPVLYSVTCPGLGCQLRMGGISSGASEARWGGV